ncbi:hypothetical protein KP509_05G021500 [Ceratopteris richardii]|uniref:G-patch domain-containing protein n=2 Tax=Ceratopteris richardii TaxID=49495 RepID=A0A8T2URR7_CERRI|nr:hypothetical protein KP509_05G021500 [Ceratopteris richardii]
MEGSRSWTAGAFAAQIKRQREREEAFETSLIEDLGDDFQLPITHRPTENLDVDNMEQASEDTQIASSNVGFRLLQKMGWKGKGLGKDEQGMVEPIRAKCRDAKLGLGKQEQDDFYTAEENVHRKKLEVELEETEELAKKREVEAEREQKIQSEVKEIRKVFYCELCNKQYKLAMEFETHLSSYDHNHKKRFKEMKEQQTNRGRDERQKREQLRHEKELQRLADAHRQQQQPPSLTSTAPTEVDSSNTTTLPKLEQRATFKFGFSSKPAPSKVLWRWDSYHGVLFRAVQKKKSIEFYIRCHLEEL